MEQRKVIQAEVTVDNKTLLFYSLYYALKYFEVQVLQHFQDGVILYQELTAKT